MSKEPIQYQASCMDDYDPSSMDAQVAQQHILDSVYPVQESETLAIRDALGRILASPITSDLDVPGHTNSAMDGYAVRGTDLPSDATQRLKVIGTAFAGRPFANSVTKHECVRIMTGAVMPTACDTVIMQEHVQLEADEIIIDDQQQAGQNVRLAGEDIAKGDSVFQPGRRLSPADIGLLASLGIAKVSVIRKLKVAFFSTGDELTSIGQPLASGQIYDSNRYTLWSMLSEIGVEIIDLGVVRDAPELVEQAFKDAAAQADVIITSGGVSVGEADFVKETLANLGQVNFWKVAMKPGRPLAFGQVEQAYFFGLPGNPVSVMVTFYIFVQAAIEKMMGGTPRSRLRLQASCKNQLRKRAGRVEYQRGMFEVNADGSYSVTKTGAQGSGILRSMSDANCFIFLPMESEGVAAGAMVEIWPFDSFR